MPYDLQSRKENPPSPAPSRTILPVLATPVCCHVFGRSKFSRQAFARTVPTDPAKLAISYPLCLRLKVTALGSVPLIINLAPPIIFCLSPYTSFTALIRTNKEFVSLLYLCFLNPTSLQYQLQEEMDLSALSLLYVQSSKTV